MVEELKLIRSVREQEAFPDVSPVVGRVSDCPGDGYLIVKTTSGRSLQARMVSGLAARKQEQLLGQEVILLFENNDPDKPIAVADLQPTGDFASALKAASEGEEINANVDDETVLIQAKQKIELRVGKASIVIDDNGKITIRGANLLSRSTGPIRIKGGHVDIN